MKNNRILAWVCVGIMSAMTGSAEEAGDQILDGIGETALIARYPFDGHLRDASRNAYHASLPPGERTGYPEDATFGTVLSAPGDNGGFPRVPGVALASADAFSLSGWWQVRVDGAPGVFFDFRSSAGGHLGAEWLADRSVAVQLTANEGVYAVDSGEVSVPVGEWAHIAVVLDPSQRILSLYLNGERVGATGDVEVLLDEVFPPDDAAGNRLFLGSPSRVEGADIVRLYDVRLYNIALADHEVNRIFTGVTEGPGVDDADDIAAADRAAWAIVAGLRGVPDIEVETRQGRLPHLPWFLPGDYATGREGPPVRVIWPAPNDISAVMNTGEYYLTGTVPGTDLRPRARVLVKSSGEPLAEPRTADGDDLGIDSGVVIYRGTSVDGAGPGRDLYPFPLNAVHLEPDDRGEPTPFMENRDKFIDGLVASSPDQFLYMFRDAFGQPQPEGAEPLRGWDARTVKLRGHATGHYLTALAQGYAGATHDDEARAALREKMDYMVEVLYELSSKSGRPTSEGGEYNADPTAVPVGPGKERYDSDLTEDGIRTDYWNWGEGFISAYPPDQFIMLEDGATYGGSDRQIWAPYYTLDKILKGLLDCYEVTADERGLAVATRMGLWVYERLRPLPEDTLESMWGRYIAGEYGGMNAVMARLHAETGDERFLEGARIFDNVSFFYGGADRPHGLARNVDTIRGLHSNQHIPQIIGALRIFRESGIPEYYHIAENFWNYSYHAYTYSIGGVAGARNPNNAECYTAEPDSLFAMGFSQGGQNETCATYNLLKLTRDLFMHNQDGRYMDYYEQALYNQILASVSLEHAGNTYHVPLNPGARKGFGNANMIGFTCCNGTALDSNTKLQNSIYFRNRDNTALYVNLYIPSTLTWGERDVSIRQETRYPYGESTRLTVEGDGDRFELFVRIPGWVGEGASVTVNGEAPAGEMIPGSYLRIDRVWTDGDTVDLHFPFDFRLHRVMDRPDLASIFYGPVLLAVEEETALSDWRRVTLNVDDMGSSLQGDPGSLRFGINGLGLKPFFEFGTERHSVYLKIQPE